MPSKKKKYNSRFPPARIKKIMQTDDDVGKVAAAVPVIISRALELFIESLILKTNETTVARNAKTLTTSHIKQTIEGEKKFDFLRDLVSTIPDHQTEDDGGENSGHVEPKKRGPRGPRKPKDGTSSRKRKDRKSSSESSEANANDDEETETDEEDNNGTASAYASPETAAHSHFQSPETAAPAQFQSPEMTCPSTSLQLTSPGMPPPMGMPMGSPGLAGHPTMQMTPPGMSGPSTSMQFPPSAYPLSPHIPHAAAAHTLPPPLPFNCFPNPLMSQVPGMAVPSGSGVMGGPPQHAVEDDDYDT